jgi:hypothetical protein
MSGQLLQNLKTANEKRKITFLIQLLLELENPPLDILLSYAADNELYFEIIKNSLQKKQEKIMKKKIIPELITILRTGETEKKKRVAQILANLRTKTVIEKIHSRLMKPQGINKITLLNILAAHGEEARELIPDLKNMLIDEKDMWIRYYVLKTLFAIHPQPDRLSPLLANLSEDTQELVRLEARGLLKDLNK